MAEAPALLSQLCSAILSATFLRKGFGAQTLKPNRHFQRNSLGPLAERVRSAVRVLVWGPRHPITFVNDCRCQRVRSKLNTDWRVFK